MALKYYKNVDTGEVKRSLKELTSPWQEILVAPAHKFMVAADPTTGKSKLKDSEGQLKARARNHSRNVDIDANIQINSSDNLKSQASQAFLNSKGERRRKIDDI